MYYALIFFISTSFSYFLTLKIRTLALKLNIIDEPSIERKKHTGRTPLLGGTAIFLSFFCIIFLAKNQILSGSLELKHWIGVFIGGLILIIGGFLDDKLNLSPKLQILFPLFACFSVILGGVGVTKITNPLTNEHLLFSNITSNIFIIIWLLCIMYTTKLLDGLDGLVSGVVGIGAFIIFIFTLTTKYYQPDIGLVSLVLAGACLGFLILNWHPAKIFLGEGGSIFLGYILGVIAIISGGKVAITLLIIGIPAIDMGWTILRRTLNNQNPLTSADRSHLHHRLNDSGLGTKKTVLLYYAFSCIFGVTSIFLQSRGKFIALNLVLVLMITLVIYFSIRKNQKLP